ncbi:SIR2 family protein [Aeromicrobium sp. JJY06]|uniref:SIR2 family protein n=1 Tax=Aeromicrobium sp. JJY06 TaxID=3373478 RepID=UPI00376EC986
MSALTPHEFLSDHLRHRASPYLFVGSGLSRRYADLPDWEGLLRHFAAFTDQPLEYYRGLASGHLPLTATLLAERFYKVWWEDKRFADSREMYGSLVTTPASSLKIETAKFFEDAVSSFRVPRRHRTEFDALSSANVEGIVTTNYDNLLSVVFPDYTVYSGQDELLFANPQGIAEIYMIHGSSRDPGSLVLTQEDYDDFRDRDAYLAAKLMTFFAEHPIIFIGYGMNDDNVLAVLRSLVRALRGKNAERLKDQLILINWDQSSSGEVRSRTIQVEDASIQAWELVVPDFLGIFQALASKDRALPARVLRQLKDQIYELVKNNDPDGRLVQVSDINSGDDQLDVVFGVGAKMTVKGLIGLSRWDLVDDLLGCPDRDLPSEQIIREVFARSFASNWYVPYWKHLRKGNFLDAHGGVGDIDRLPKKVQTYVERDLANLGARRTTRSGAFVDALAELGEEAMLSDPWMVLELTKDADGLRDYLVANRNLRQQKNLGTPYAKLAIVFDWLAYGPPAGAGK